MAEASPRELGKSEQFPCPPRTGLLYAADRYCRAWLRSAEGWGQCQGSVADKYYNRLVDGYWRVLEVVQGLVGGHDFSSATCEAGCKIDSPSGIDP